MSAGPEAAITIAVQCHNFQRRFCWMLSSLAQQTAPRLVHVEVACLAGNGRPTTWDVAKAVRGASVTVTHYEEFNVFQKRGVVRNDQLKACNTRWIMFGDCDMVYHPDYYARLVHLLDTEHKDATYMLSSGRISNPKDFTNLTVNSQVLNEAREVPDAFAMANRMEKVPMRNVGAGFCQIVNTIHGAHGGFYVDPATCRDWDWKSKGSNPKSDMQFRRRVSRAGGDRRALPQWFTDNAIHLNHNRDPEAGHHIEEQR